MTDELPTPQPRETLQGDRLCAQCLQPLVGRTIEREPETGLLFVRCGECGTASALFEYPTATPWINRIKAVIASTLALLLVAVTLGVAGIAGGFTAASSSIAAEAAGQALSETYAASSASAGEEKLGSKWLNSNEGWLATDEGRAALAGARWSPDAIASLMLVGALATVIATPLLLFLSIALSRHRNARRMLMVMVPSLIGTVCALALSMSLESARWQSSRTWASIAAEAHLRFYLLAGVVWFSCVAAVLALVGPTLVASIARLILPARDRGLVAWLWEWRGKPVPRS